MAARVAAHGSVFDVQRVEPLFGPIGLSYDVSADGQRFLVNQSVSDSSDTPAVIVSWPQLLKK